MKSTTTNTLGYTGIVTLSQYAKDKKFVIAKVHNKGGEPLFNFLTNCLAGEFDLAKLDRPVKIMLLNISDTDEITKASNADFIHLLTKPEKVSANVVKYSFMIPQAILIGTSFNAIGLYTDSTSDSATDLQDNYAAYCRVGDEVLRNSISTSSILVVDWELVISNKESD